MIEVKYNIFDEVVYLNTATMKLEKVIVRGIRIVPTGISKAEDGKDVLDGYVILYETQNGPVLAESEVFSSEEEAREAWVRFVHGL